MKYELWHSSAEGSYMLLDAGDRSNDHAKAVDQKVVWTTEADSYEQAKQNQYDHLGWGKYTPGAHPFDYPPAASQQRWLTRS
jgi:hypothetical protein